ncbi:response regulator [Spirochaeta africana]|uniref:Response regulator containing a CheY-like receiver domain and an HD-GYP domain n=1 Tax=Spirochaeta africana (strain ATCC 700263 / DSM 8902 / Z-7692) TaxID=889378 RepID=H9UIR4_SPIAZ|nr:response regulator [Spirochaeta africana]AFG37407.1 response regulator containing a CheY-like receiver domain and an HD-GYP domain [Spirochaeta africana DSM 8902]
MYNYVDPREIKAHMLIVDDDQQNAEIAAAFFGDWNLDITHAESADRALELIDETTYDIILMDIMMPHMDGITLTEKIKSRPDYIDVPIIFLTAKVDKQTMRQAFEARGSDYLTKPFWGVELQLRVGVQLKNRYMHLFLGNLNTEIEKQKRRAEKAESELAAARKRIAELESGK